MGNLDSYVAKAHCSLKKIPVMLNCSTHELSVPSVNLPVLVPTSIVAVPATLVLRDAYRVSSCETSMYTFATQMTKGMIKMTSAILQC